MKNRVKIIIIFLILFFNIFMYIIPSSYQKKYKVDGYNIIEKYNNKKHVYYYEIEGKDKFTVALKSKYKTKKKLIKNIKSIAISDGYCIIPSSNKLNFYPLCIKDDKYISYQLVEELKDKINKTYYKNISQSEKSYKSLDINYLNNKKYLIWNYTSFYYLNNKENETIKVFNTDYYQIDLASRVNNYLFLPNYDQGYSFNEAYIINMNTAKIEKWNMKYDISNESRIVGVNNKSIFLVDEKNKEMYEIVPHRKKIRKVSGRLLIGDKFVKYNLKTIINDNLVFKPTIYYDYEIMNNKLYQKINKVNTLISDNATSIVYKDFDTVYYLVKDSLYMYNPNYGNIKIMTNFEWEFNYDNLIFIY